MKPKAFSFFGHFLGVIAFFLLSSSSSPIKSVAAQQAKLYRGFCLKSANFSSNSAYHTNVLSLLFTLTTRSSNVKFSNFTAGDNGPDQVKGLFLCRPDLPSSACQGCVSTASQDFVDHCTYKKQAILWYDVCMVRYSNRSIFSVEETEPVGSNFGSLNVSQPDAFPALLNTTMESLIAEASSPNNSLRFATGKADFTSLETLYGLVLCTPDITPEECKDCLRKALSLLPSCCGGLSVWTSVFLPSCQLRYDTAPFFSISPPPLPPSPVALAPLPSHSPNLLAWSFTTLYVLCLSALLNFNC